MLASGSMPEAYESHLKPVPEVRKSDSSQVSFALDCRAFRERRKDRRHADRAAASPALAAPARSCRAAYRCGRLPATRGRPPEPESPWRQCFDHPAQRVAVHITIDPDPPAVAEFDLHHAAPL